jgi:hypothetical protein
MKSNKTAGAGRRERRAFSAEFKAEAVLRQEQAFAKKVAVYFAKESR